MEGRVKILSQLFLENEALEELKSYPNVDIQMLSGMPTKEDLINAIPGCYALIVGTFVYIDKDIIEAAGPQFRVISTFSAGYEHIDLKECSARNIKVGYIRDLGANTVGEFTLGLLLNTSRRISESIISTRAKNWKLANSSGKTLEWFTGRSLIGSTIGIFGLGQIGLNLVKRLAGFEVKKIIYRNRRPNPDADQLGCEYVSMQQLLAQSDYLICTCSANPDTQGIFNMNAFRQMKPTAVFINVSRGIVVNQDDLYEALSTGLILGAGLDVTTPEPLPVDHKLHTLSNCMITPHIAWAEKQLNIDKSRCVIQNVLHVLDQTDSEKGFYLSSEIMSGLKN